MENPANESGRKKGLFYVIYLKVGFYIPAFTAHLSAWLAPKCFLALSVLIESVLSCLGGPAAFLASVSKVPPAPVPPPRPSTRCAYLFVLGLLRSCSERRGEVLLDLRRGIACRWPQAKWRGPPWEVTRSDTTDVQRRRVEATGRKTGPPITSRSWYLL